MTKHTKGKVVAFRLWPPYSVRISEQAKAARLRESEFARIATMMVADSGMLDLGERMKSVETELVRLREDLHKALEDDGSEC